MQQSKSLFANTFELCCIYGNAIKLQLAFTMQFLSLKEKKIENILRRVAFLKRNKQIYKLNFV